MKTQKNIIFLLVILMMLTVCKPVSASISYGVELISNKTMVQQGTEIEITIKVKDIIDIDGGIAGLSAKLEYDTSKLERVGEGQSLNGFMLVEGDTIELAKYPGVTADTEIAKFIFKAKATGETQIKLTGIEVANGTDTFSLGITVTETILITSPENSADDPTKQLSANNNLSSLLIDESLIPNFNKDTLTYTLEAVENSKTSIKISATTQDAKAKVTGTGTKNLNFGQNTFEILVTAEDGTEKVYKVNVERKAAVDNNQNNNSDSKNENKKDETQSTTKLPQTGETTVIFSVLGMIIIIAIISFIKMKKLSGIK